MASSLDDVYPEDERAADAEARNLYLNKSTLAAMGQPFMIPGDGVTVENSKKFKDERGRPLPQYEVQVRFPGQEETKLINLGFSESRDKVFARMAQRWAEDKAAGKPPREYGPLILVETASGYFDLQNAPVAQGALT